MDKKKNIKSETLKRNIIAGFFEEHMSQTDIAKKYNISQEYVFYIINLEDKDKIKKEELYRKQQKQVKSKTKDSEQAKQVKNLYFKKNLSQKEIASKLGLSQTYISNMLLNKRSINVRIDSEKAEEFNRLLKLNNINFSTWARQKVNEYINIKK